MMMVIVLVDVVVSVLWDDRAGDWRYTIGYAFPSTER